jgi:hypothetical protein
VQAGERCGLQNGTQLGAQQVRAIQADADAAQAEEGVVFLGQGR